jgi:hypothetical protein
MSTFSPDFQISSPLTRPLRMAGVGRKARRKYFFTENKID